MARPRETLTLEEVHAILMTARDDLYKIPQGGLPLQMSPDTAFALAEALGCILRAKALLGRDIDDNRTKPT